MQETWVGSLIREDPTGCRATKPARVCSVAQSRLTLCGPMDCRLPGSSVCEIFQARILEWVTISFSRGYSQPGDRTCISCGSCIGAGILYHWAIWEAMCHNYWACAPEPRSHNYWSPLTWSLCSTREATAMRSLLPQLQRSPRSPQLEKTCAATKTQHSQK